MRPGTAGSPARPPRYHPRPHVYWRGHRAAPSPPCCGRDGSTTTRDCIPTNKSTRVCGGRGRGLTASPRLSRSACIERADGLITLSQRAKDSIQRVLAVAGKGTPTIVVPSCVDLEHFCLDPSRRPDRGESVRLVYVGSIGGRYRFDGAGRFAAIAGRELGRVHLRVLTHTESGVVGADLGAAACPRTPGRLTVSRTRRFRASWPHSTPGCTS